MAARDLRRCLFGACVLLIIHVRVWDQLLFGGLILCAEWNFGVLLVLSEACAGTLRRSSSVLEPFIVLLYIVFQEKFVLSSDAAVSVLR